VEGVGRGLADFGADGSGSPAGGAVLHGPRHLALPSPHGREYELPTATFFDLGVYLIVMGTLMTIFVEMAQEEGR